MNTLAVEDMALSVASLILSAEQWVILAHEKPDGDTLGSSGALALLGERLKKKVFWGGKDPIPPHYSFMDKNSRYQSISFLPRFLMENSKSSVVLCCDISTIKRVDETILKTVQGIPIVNIDHHLDNELFGDINWIDTEASATAEIITQLFLAVQCNIECEEANFLYAALVSDNGCFRFASTSVKSHEVAITLLRAGASPADIARNLEQRMTVAGMRLWGLALNRVQTLSQGKVAVTYLTLDDYAQTGALHSENEGLVNQLLLIRGVSLVALCTEDMNGVRVSLRAHAPFSARRVASVFAGGGHELAAGCQIKAKMNAALDQLTKEMDIHVQTLDSLN